MKKIITFILTSILIFLTFSSSVHAATSSSNPQGSLEEAIFDDKVLFQGYVDKYKDKPRDVIVAMMNDSTIGTFKLAAAIRIFSADFADQTVTTEKNFSEKTLLRILGHENSPYVQTESMSALIALDRYKYFKIMVPRLIEKLDHYDDAVVDIAYDDLSMLITKSTARTREARIIFNTLRKILFLSRKKLEYIEEPDEKLQKKLDLLFWCIKVLGTQELKQLPSEVIRLL
jgi:hypothetical protein